MPNRTSTPIPTIIPTKAPIDLSKGFVMDDFNHNLLTSTMPYQIKAVADLAQVKSQDVREVDPAKGNKLGVQSTTNPTCKVRAFGTPEIHPKGNPGPA